MNYCFGYNITLNCRKIRQEVFIEGDYYLEDDIIIVKEELIKYWVNLCQHRYDLFIENTEPFVLKLNLFRGVIGSDKYFEYISSIQVKFAVCFNEIPPFVFIPEENLLKILRNSKETEMLDNIINSYKIILKHEYGHCLFFQELSDKYSNDDELIREYEKIRKNNSIYLEEHNKIQNFITTYDARKHYYSSIPNEICANKLANVNLDELIYAEEYLGKIITRF